MKELGKHYFKDVILPCLVLGGIASTFLGIPLAFACTVGVALVVTLIALIAG